MKIAIYCNNYKPEDGGANTLLGTVLQEIRERKDVPFEFIFLYCGDRKEVYEKEVGGYHYFNLNHGYLLSIETASKITRMTGIELTKRFDCIVKNEHVDIVWFLSHFYAYTGLPYLFTVWDLGHRTTDFPEVSKWYIRRGRDYMYKHMIDRARYVITANQTGKKEIMACYDCEESKIAIAPFPVSAFCFGASRKPDFLKDELFFFYPAQFWPHKNHICVVEALKILKEQYGLRPKIFFTGSDKGNKAFIEEKINEYQLKDQITITGFIADEELKYLYEHAYALIFASMMGPNNLPPEEAVYLGCPVIITDIEGHKEQMGDCAAYFDGNDPESLALVMKEYLESRERRDELVEVSKSMQNSLRDFRYTDAVIPCIQGLKSEIN